MQLLSANVDVITPLAPAAILRRLEVEILRTGPLTLVNWQGRADSAGVVLWASLPWQRGGMGCRLTAELRERAGTTIVQAALRPALLPVVVAIGAAVGAVMELARGRRGTSAMLLGFSLLLLADTWLTLVLAARRFAELLESVSAGPAA